MLRIGKSLRPFGKYARFCSSDEALFPEFAVDATVNDGLGTLIKARCPSARPGSVLHVEGGEAVVFHTWSGVAWAVVPEASPRVGSMVRLKETARPPSPKDMELPTFGCVVDHFGLRANQDATIGAMVFALGQRPLDHDARGLVRSPLETGVKMIDVLTPIGCGQSMIVCGPPSCEHQRDVAMAAVVGQMSTDVKCVYVALGRTSAELSRLEEQLQNSGTWDNTLIVAPPCIDSGLYSSAASFIAPFAACTIAEKISRRGGNALVIHDDLSFHSREFDLLSLALDDIREDQESKDLAWRGVYGPLVERSAKEKNGKLAGSLTSMLLWGEVESRPLYELMSLSDGQIKLNPDAINTLPPLDVPGSLSRHGSKVQHPTLQEICGRLRLEYLQLLNTSPMRPDDEYTKKVKARTARTAALLQQNLKIDRSVRIGELILMMLASSKNLLRDLPVEKIPLFEAEFRKIILEGSNAELLVKAELSKGVSDDLVAAVRPVVAQCLAAMAVD